MFNNPETVQVFKDLSALLRWPAPAGRENALSFTLAELGDGITVSSVQCNKDGSVVMAVQFPSQAVAFNWYMKFG